MAMRHKSLEEALRDMIDDLRVELAEEFDRNFERQGFFNAAWQRRRSPLRPGGSILIDSGRLRRSVRAEVRGMSVVFTSTHPAAAIHNEGGEIVVTARMKRYFWAKYYESRGSLGRRKDGSARQDKRNARLTTAAEFYRAMALMRAGSVIRMPRRRFIGESPEIEAAAVRIITEHLETYFNTIEINRQ